jgi:hypothetical protein
VLRLAQKPHGGEESDPERRERLTPGLHIVRCTREEWEKVIDKLLREGIRTVVLSPDPRPSRLETAAQMEHFWFRSEATGESIPAAASCLSRMAGRFARPGTRTGIEGIQTLLYWNGLEDVTALLHAVDERLVEVGSTGFLHVMEETLREDDLAALGHTFPSRPTERVI